MVQPDYLREAVIYVLQHPETFTDPEVLDRVRATLHSDRSRFGDDRSYIVRNDCLFGRSRDGRGRPVQMREPLVFDNFRRIRDYAERGVSTAHLPVIDDLRIIELLREADRLRGEPYTEAFIANKAHDIYNGRRRYLARIARESGLPPRDHPDYWFIVNNILGQ